MYKRKKKLRHQVSFHIHCLTNRGFMMWGLHDSTNAQNHGEVTIKILTLYEENTNLVSRRCEMSPPLNRIFFLS